MANFANRRFELKRKSENGHLFENFVYLLLREKIKPPATVHFYRTKDQAEVDFVVNRGKNVEAIEVKFRELAEPKVSRSLRHFMDRYSPARTKVIHVGKKFEKELDGLKVEFVPWWELMRGATDCLGRCDGGVLTGVVSIKMELLFIN